MSVAPLSLASLSEESIQTRDGRAFLGVGQEAAPPSGKLSEGLRSKMLECSRSRWFRWRVNLWSRLTLRKPIDWDGPDGFEAQLQKAQFRDYGSIGEAFRSLGWAGLVPDGLACACVGPRGIGVAGDWHGRVNIWRLNNGTISRLASEVAHKDRVTVVTLAHNGLRSVSSSLPREPGWPRPEWTERWRSGTSAVLPQDPSLPGE